MQVLLPIIAIASLVGAWLDPQEGPWGFIPLLFLVAISFAHSSARIVDDDLIVAVVPFWRRRVPLSSIASTRIETWRPLRDYGGWGLRVGRDATLYNMRGNRGVRVELDGRDIVIGSDDPERLQADIDAARGGWLRP